MIVLADVLAGDPLPLALSYLLVTLTAAISAPTACSAQWIE
jgi:hypothetical protein